MNLTFQDPPVGSAYYAEVAKTLRENPGKWAVIDLNHLAQGSVNAFPTIIRKGRMSKFPATEFEAMNRKGETYIRFIGDPE